MATDITKNLRKALADLEKEKARVDTQIAALRNALAALGVAGVRGQPKGKKLMSAAQRKAVSRRMKAYWAKRKADAAKVKGAGGK